MLGSGAGHSGTTPSREVLLFVTTNPCKMFLQDFDSSSTALHLRLYKILNLLSCLSNLRVVYLRLCHSAKIFIDAHRRTGRHLLGGRKKFALKLTICPKNRQLALKLTF